MLLIPHLIWLTNNDFITIAYGLARTDTTEFQLLNHIINPTLYILKQIGILVPFFPSFFFVKKLNLNLI